MIKSTLKKVVVSSLIGATLLTVSAVPLQKSCPGFLDWSMSVSAAIYQDYEYTESIDGIILNEYIGSSSTITIPSTINNKVVIAIGHDFLKENKVVKTVTIPNSIKTIGDNFCSDSNVETVNMSSNIQKIGEYSFNSSKLKNFNYNGNSLIEVGDNAFRYTDWINNYKIKNPGAEAIILSKVLIKYLNTSSTSLSTNNIGLNGIQYIASYAFENCSNLRSININGVHSIGLRAFYGCFNLSTVTIDDTLTKLGRAVFGSTAWFRNNTADYLCAGRVLFYIKNKNITSFDMNVLPSSICSIAEGTFETLPNLTTVDLRQIQYISKSAFNNTQLTTVKQYDTTLNYASDLVKNNTSAFSYTPFIKTAIKARANQLLTLWGVTKVTSTNNAVRESQKYEAAKKIFTKMSSILSYKFSDNNQNADTLINGEGVCAGIARSYYHLLLNAGFRSDELMLVNPTNHLLNGIKLYDKWYFVENTSNCALKNLNFKDFLRNWTEINDSSLELITGVDSEYYLDNNEEIYYDFASNYNGIRGDINISGSVDNSDLILINSYLSRNTTLINKAAADMNRDGEIDISDMAVIKSVIMGG